VWHKGCFSCAECRRPLDSILSCDGPDKEIYCKSCYAKRFGPKGYGYGYSPTLVSSSGDSTAPYVNYVLSIFEGTKESDTFVSDSSPELTPDQARRLQRVRDVVGVDLQFMLPNRCYAEAE
jgi:hypothetical protein